MAGADIHDAGAARAHRFCLSSRVLAFLGYSFMFGVVAFTAVALATGLVGGGEDSPRLNDRSPWHESCSVFCSGDLLRRVQLAGIFNDSKSFVDSPMRADPADVLAAFARIPEDAPPSALEQFVADYFEAPGSDVEHWVPSDYSEDPAFLQRVGNATLRDFARGINRVWEQLGRKASADVATHPSRHTLLHLPNPVVVPGGRFRESYYWDSFWIVRGLLVSGMRETARGVIENFVDMVDRFGFVPNGGRAYYLTRSQPPLLSEMVLTYWNATGDEGFLRGALAALDKEYAFWMAQEGQGAHSGSAVPLPGGYVLNRYLAFTELPRPESFVEDAHTAEGLAPAAAGRLFTNVASGAATGWDYSSRWFADAAHLRTIAASRVVPADLNAFMLRMEDNLAAMKRSIGDEEGAQRYAAAAGKRREAIAALLWNEEEGRWNDYWMPPPPPAAQSGEGARSGGLRSPAAAVEASGPTTRQVLARRLAAEAGAASGAAVREAANAEQGREAARLISRGVSLSLEGAATAGEGGGGVGRSVFPSSYFGLWAGLMDDATDAAQRRVVQSLRDSGLVDVGGVATSTARTGQQWDWPNAWAPVQWILARGLERLRVPEAAQLAGEIKAAWVETALVAYRRTGFLYEKYNATQVGDGGGGGEYVPQRGFGWTNGVLLELLAGGL